MFSALGGQSFKLPSRSTNTSLTGSRTSKRNGSLVSGIPVQKAESAADDVSTIDPNESKGPIGGKFNLRTTVSIDTDVDEQRAAFLEHAFTEYYHGKHGKKSSNKTKNEAVLDDFLRASDLKCSNLRQVAKLIELMRRNKLNEEEDDNA
mmetsp:Transcript_12389/g.22096  ORF Transcript_12389/g.22096 Transcript_12389/m.22096 type:complete len:149 (+) Transcript_12389:121-567(+)|eukprot:CAMPEP_0184544842 /NCGR_PEP_ID=MMETSP0199_2-20130426/3901_1 /TAXON_ID=1112570 /ORGANISM="Thraustochytrium sp., Strain LLF1b" /LENGTH=148 /DNA_ID=CAMNT_0026939073 /DNA_START=89 /DNA_END=535 /DNA_ORIENTATION=-